jgi:antirestriction protein ArdC
MSVYDIVTERVIQQMQSGVIPWQKPWTGTSSGAISRATGRPYSLVNQFLLGKPGEYVTFKQCNDEGGKVKKGSKSGVVVFWKVIQKDRVDADGEVIRDDKGVPRVKTFPLLQYYRVFHIDDCEGLDPKWTKDVVESERAKVDEDAQKVFDDYISREKIGFNHVRGSAAFYSPSRDVIGMPLVGQFSDTGKYYSTLFHEAVHSTGHKSRLNRLDDKGFSWEQDYSKEELVAEIGAAVMLNMVGMENKSTIKNNVAYIQNWIKVLQNDTKMIIAAASEAEKAVNMIRGEVSENAGS